MKDRKRIIDAWVLLILLVLSLLTIAASSAFLIEDSDGDRLPLGTSGVFTLPGDISGSANAVTVTMDHADLADVAGFQSHSAIDTHLSDTATHFTEAAIDHQNLTGAGTNDHSAIDTHLSDTSTHFPIYDNATSVYVDRVWSSSFTKSQVDQAGGGGGSGDMLQSVYDSDGDGVVDAVNSADVSESLEIYTVDAGAKGAGQFRAGRGLTENYEIAVSDASLFLTYYQDEVDVNNNVTWDIQGGATTAESDYIWMVENAEKARLTKNGHFQIGGSLTMPNVGSAPAATADAVTLFVESSIVPPDSETALLISPDSTQDATAFADLSTFVHTVTAMGDTHHSTEFVTFGATAAKFDRVDDYIYIDTSTEFHMLAGDFTYDAFIYPLVIDGTMQTIFAGDRQSGDHRSVLVSINTTGKAEGKCYSNGTSASVFGTVTGTTTLQAGQWYHVAYTRSGNTFSIWVDGVQEDSVVETGTMYSAPYGLMVGAYNSPAPDIEFSGYIDEIRVSRGIARTDFPPVQPYASQTEQTLKVRLADGTIKEVTLQ
jgi:hypothetical protein